MLKSTDGDTFEDARPLIQDLTFTTPFEEFRRLSGNPRYFNAEMKTIERQPLRTNVRKRVVFFFPLDYTICMKDNLIKSRTCVYNINYHVVWSVKYRKKIITQEIEENLKQWASEIASEKGFTIHLFEAGQMDHIHCFISAPPKISISYIVKMLKGITGRKLFMFFPDIKTQLWNGQLWNHSYYVETIGSISEENIKKYIEKQAKSY